MKIIAILFISAVSVYVLLKIGPNLYRPFLLRKRIKETQKKYDELIAIIDRDMAESVVRYDKWKADNEISHDLDSEQECRERMRNAIRAKMHEQEIHNKFTMLMERNGGDIKKLGEVLANFDRYIEVRLDTYRDAELSTRLLENGTMTFDEWVAVAKGGRTVTEKCERRIDIMLNS